MSLLAEIRDKFADGVRTAFPERGDDKYLHVSDIASCPTYVMARILGEPMIQPTPAQQIMWQQGLAMERSILAAVRETFVDTEARVDINALLWISVNGEGIPVGGNLSLTAYNRGTLLPTDGSEFGKLPDVVFIGHPDAIVRRGDDGLLLETKSERFAWDKVDGSFVAIAPSKPRDKYFVQGPTYAFAAKLDTFAFGVGDRVTGGVQWYPRTGEAYDTVAHLKPLLPKMASLLELYRKKEIPKAVPPAWGWEAIKTEEYGVQLRNVECARCPYAACVKNTNPLRATVAQKETVK
jgi:hypothetical protein